MIIFLGLIGINNHANIISNFKVKRGCLCGLRLNNKIKNIYSKLLLLIIYFISISSSSSTKLFKSDFIAKIMLISIN